ncbi:MAG: hypothetical protein IKJ36_01475 [Clostridia bacterium]|nr:hypothetical protein [Clostridia bacterium]
MSEANLQGKYFSITDPKDVSTVIYQVNRTEREFAKTSPKYTVERLEYSEEYVGANKKKTFFIENPAPEGNPLVILSFAKERVVVNMGFLDYDVVKISKKPMPMKFKTLYSEQETDFKEFAYTPNMKRPISIIDPETGEEVKPILYFDEESNEVKGKCKLKPYKKYFAFEIREEKK